MSTILKQAPTSKFRLGLEKEGKQMFETSTTSWEIPRVNGKFQHGLSKEDLAKVEAYYGRKFDDPDSFEFWSNMVIEVKNTINPYDLDSPKDILESSVLKKIGIVAPSLEEADDPMRDYLYVLHNDVEAEGLKATLYEKIDSAIIELNKLRQTPSYLIYVAKYILPRSAGIANEEMAYSKLRELINGDLTDTRGTGVDTFWDAVSLDKKILYATVDFRDALAKNIIRLNGKKYYYNVLSQTQYGKNEKEAVTFLTNPKNQEELGTGSKSDESYSIRSQLKNY